MYVLGINPGWHDSSAALLKDGRLQVLVEQDRVSRKKHAMGERPTKAVAECLAQAGITLDDVEAVALGWDERPCMAQTGEKYDPEEYRNRVLPRDALPRRREPPIHFVRHHVAHAASGLWTSGFDRAAILVLDGRGETQATTLAMGSASGIEWLEEWDVSQSLGNFYGYAAEWAGFTFWGAGKLMGLASYGRPRHDGFLVPTPTGYRFEGSGAPTPEVGQQQDRHRALLDAYFRSVYPFAPADPSDVMAHANFAASVQVALEEAVLQLARVARERTGAEDLVVAGGVGLNCTMNGRLARTGIFRDLHVPPVTADTGVSLGAALVVDRELHPGREAPPRMEHAYWGVDPSGGAVEKALKESGLDAVRVPEDELLARVAAHLVEGRIVGWYQGRAEIGQRALGARSMLCDPRDRRRLVRVNRVKGREVWRPLAPSVLEEHYGELFDGAAPSPTTFMLAAVPVRESAQSLAPATTHVDGSARPQAVRRATSPRYWGLIDAFRERTGVPAVMNTSLNLAGEPIVHSPEDAISVFRRSEMDVLAIDDYLLEKATS